MSPMFAPATDQVEYELPEADRYIATCVNIEDAPDNGRGFGPGVKWTFKLVHAATGQTVLRGDGSEYTLWQWTSVKMSPKAKARPIIEALLGRPLADKEVPDSRHLIGKAMITLLIHETGENGTRARVTSCKPYVPQGMAAPAVQPTPQQVDANGDDDNSALIEQVKGAIRKAEILQTPKHLDWLALGPELIKSSRADLEMLLGGINNDIAAA